MASKYTELQQITSRNNLAHFDTHLSAWLDVYLAQVVTTAESSQKVQRRDISVFVDYMVFETSQENPQAWTPRLSKSFVTWCQQHLHENGSRRWNDRTINRMIAHLKTFSKWIHEHRPFPLGDPMRNIKTMKVASSLEIERAISPQERRRILDAADVLVHTGAVSKDRNRYRGKERPQRKDYRPYRNRAIVYTLIETGMRRGAITRIKLVDVNMVKRVISVQEKGGEVHKYHISKEGIKAIEDYIANERGQDGATALSLFLPAASVGIKNDHLSERTINNLWNQVREAAMVDADKTPHSARHGMGKHIMEKTGNVSAIQRQLGHKNPAYSMQYARISSQELHDVLDDRE